MTHLSLSLLIAIFIYHKWKKLAPSLIGALSGGLFLDIDHLVDYYLAFGTNFNITYFLKGYEFLKSDKIYVFLHAWEWVLLLFVLTLIISRFNLKKSVKLITVSLLLSFNLGLASHLTIDTFTNKTIFQAYFLTYRLYRNFELKELVTTEHYTNHKLMKDKIKLY